MSMYEVLGRRDERLEERKTYWDEIISRRHRAAWGIECKMYDIDHISCSNPLPYDPGTLCMECWWGKTYALVEYKHEHVLENFDKHVASWRWQMRCYRDLANPGEKPLFYCVYQEDDFAMLVIPANYYARQLFGEARWVNEHTWVWFLHGVRVVPADEADLKRLHKTHPSNRELA